MMANANLFQPIQVTCYSGRTYADRPSSFIWQDRKCEVEKIEKEWVEPGEKHFIVRSQDEKRFELCYIEREDSWSLIEL